MTASIRPIAYQLIDRSGSVEVRGRDILTKEIIEHGRLLLQHPPGGHHGGAVRSQVPSSRVSAWGIAASFDHPDCVSIVIPPAFTETVRRYRDAGATDTVVSGCELDGDDARLRTWEVLGELT
ncbi:hypothetical protein [Streptomyces sp. NPDC055134]